MLMPRKVAHRKHHRGRTFGLSKGGNELAFGEYGIQALEPGWLTARQIEAARIAMTRAIKRGGKVWINIFPDKPVTKKPAETRMGSGKGNPEFWVAVVRPGRVLFELRCMEVYAAQIDRMDQGIGRILAALEETGQLDNTAEIGKVRKQIARINTLIRQREIALAEAGQ